MTILIKEYFNISTKLNDQSNFEKLLPLIKDKINNFYEVDNYYIDFILNNTLFNKFIDKLKQVSNFKISETVESYIFKFLTTENLKYVSKLFLVVLLSYFPIETLKTISTLNRNNENK